MSTLVNYKTSKNDNPDEIRNLLCTSLKNAPSSKTKDDKSSASAKEIVLKGVTCLSISKHVVHSTFKFDILRKQSLIDRGSN